MTHPDEFDRSMMSLALSLAVQGRGYVEPNPLVGAVVARNGKIVGQGWHQKYGGPHAEIFAMREAGELVRKSTLYITLEPCSHHGKTPPCADAIIAAGVTRVVAAMTDPFPQVAGSGLRRLREAGIEVVEGLMRDEAEQLNAPWLKLTRTGYPWIHAKWAMTLDGKIAAHTGDSRWISSEASRRIAHELRGRMDAILVGGQTVRSDDPQLTARPAGVRVPTRVILSPSGNLPDKARLLETIGEAPVLVFSSQTGCRLLTKWKGAGAELFPLIPGASIIEQILAELGGRRMVNVLAEGGGELIGSLFDGGFVNEVHVWIAPKIVGGKSAVSPVGGTGKATIAEAWMPVNPEVTSAGGDVLIQGRLR